MNGQASIENKEYVLGRVLDVSSDMVNEILREHSEDKEFLDKLKEKTDLEQKRGAVLQKIFGIDFRCADDIVRRFGNDINSIPDGDEKDLVMALKELIDLQDESLLHQIYDECEEVGVVDELVYEKKLKMAYARLYNQDLYQPKSKDLIPEDELPPQLKGFTVYDAGTDFNMIATVVGAYDKREINNYKDDWNQPVTYTQQNCSSYIRNDMLAIVGSRQNFAMVYGFGFVEPERWTAAFPGDAGSPTEKYDSGSSIAVNQGVGWYGPEQTVNNTERYSELNWYYMQGDKKQQPDYMILFKKNGVFENLDEFIKKAQDWQGQIPIVVIDEDNVLKAERDKVTTALAKYNETKNPEKAREILQKVRNNRMTDHLFCKDMEEHLETLRQDLAKQEQVIQTDDKPKQEESKAKSQEDKTNQEETKTDIKQKAKAELAEIYDGVTAQERQEGVSEMRRLRKKIQDIIKRNKEGEEVGG